MENTSDRIKDSFDKTRESAKDLKNDFVNDSRNAAANVATRATNAVDRNIDRVPRLPPGSRIERRTWRLRDSTGPMVRSLE